jgi:hypothetical protein
VKAKKEDSDNSDEEDAGKDAANEMANTQAVQEMVEKRKAFLMEHIASRVGIFANFKYVYHYHHLKPLYANAFFISGLHLVDWTMTTLA